VIGEQQWEYKVVDAFSDTLEGRLNELGRDGWEAIGLSMKESVAVVVLKRLLRPQLGPVRSLPIQFG
jgi:hypothetical protein